MEKMPVLMDDIISKIPSLKTPEMQNPRFWERQPDWNYAMDANRREPEVIHVTETHVLQPIMVDRREDIGAETINRMWRDLPRDIRLDREGVRMTIRRIADEDHGERG